MRSHGVGTSGQPSACSSDPPRDELDRLRLQVEQRLEEMLQLAGDCPGTLLEAMRYSLMAPGKRLRPILVLLAAGACGGDSGEALPAACAVEMVHTYSLIHDDLPAMDDDDLRRGQPTCHKKFGEALAILAGDALLTLAFQLLAECYLPPTAAACARELARGAGAAGMVGGQVEDLVWEGQLAVAQPGSAGRNPQLPDLENIHARKTGALFLASLRLGYWVVNGEKSPPRRLRQPGGKEEPLLDSLDAYGRCFGQLFQITDDLLDVNGASEQTGKRVHKDAARGKLTYPGLLGLQESRRRARQLASRACAALAPLGTAGARLAQLVELVLERDR